MPIDQSPHTGANTIRLFFSLGVMSLGVAATLATILGFFGSTWWAFDMLAGYRLHLAIILLAVAAAFRVGFGIATGILFLAAGLVNAFIVAPLFIGSYEPAAQGGGTLAIASVPVEETGRDAAMEWVADSGADLVFLLDTDDTWTGVQPPAGSGYQTVDQVFLGRQTGITVVARTRLEVQVSGFDNTSNPVVRAATTMGAEEVVVYAVLLPAPGTNTEMEHRNALLERIATSAAEETVPVAVVGDIGVSQWSHSFRVLLDDGVLQDSSPGHGYQGATPGNWWVGFRVPTHHLVHTDSLTVVERHIGPDLGHGRAILQATIAPVAG